jgi:uncharacterized protein YbjQ (UPF0145 family)
MGWFDWLKSTPRAPVGPFFNPQGVPNFMATRLEEDKQGKRPWVSTMTPAELALAQSHGLKMLATITSSCWLHYGFSWTRGHAEGWQKALQRMQAEALALGANAVVDVKMVTVKMETSDSMDYSLIGTAIKVEGLPSSPAPIVATVPALEFMSLLEAGIVPVGLAIGAQYDWTTRSQRDYNLMTSGWGSRNGQLTDLGQFWESVRRRAHAELRKDTARQGMGVLAHVQFGQLIEFERENQPTQYLGRHIVIGTVVDYDRKAKPPQHIELVLDMNDTDTLLTQESHHSTTSYEEEGI